MLYVEVLFLCSISFKTTRFLSCSPFFPPLSLQPHAHRFLVLPNPTRPWPTHEKTLPQTSAAAASAALPSQPLRSRAAGRKARRKKSPPFLASNASLSAIVVAEFALRKAFVRAGLTFPASLAGMVGLFAGGEGGRVSGGDGGGDGGGGVCGLINDLVAAGQLYPGRACVLNPRDVCCHSPNYYRCPYAPNANGGGAILT